MREIFLKFAAKETSMKTSRKPRVEFHTTTICFEPHVKPSFMQKYNISKLSDLAKKNLNMTWNDLAHEAYYQMGTDFQIKCIGLAYQDVKEGLNEYNEGKVIMVDRLQTILNGQCYRFIPNFHTMGFFLSFSKELKSKDFPQVKIYLTSRPNSYGIVWSFWNEGQPMIFTFAKNSYTFVLNEKEVRYLESTTSCTKDPYFNHATNHALTELTKKAENCSTQLCTPISLVGTNISTCNSIQAHFCMHHFTRWQLIRVKWLRKDPCLITEYSGQPVSESNVKEGDYYMIWDYSTKSVLTLEEYLVYDVIGLISSAGGFLGLFLGFSFLSFAFDLIDIVVYKLQTLIN